MLTKRQKETLTYIQRYKQKHGYAPSLEEIAKHLGLNSVSTAHHHIKALETLGFITREENQPRGIGINKADQVVKIPLIGLIAAGQPIEAIEEQLATVSIVNNNISNPKDFYALKVVGDSMIDEGIFDGDIVVIKKQSVAENGQTVVAIIDNNQATLKKLYREKNRFRLEPRNQTMLPFYREEVEVRGVVFQIISDVHAKTMRDTHKFRTIDLFAGIGGIRIGFENAGFETVFSNDFEPKCKTTYDLNFKDSKLVVEDIRKVGIDDIPEFEFLLGGFPCQPFSIAGYRQGFDDKKNRGNLFFYITKIIEARQPKAFLLENVKNLKTHDKGNTFKVIRGMLTDLGYHLKVKILNTMEYGNLPQNRERIYIVGFKDKSHYKKFHFPKPIKLTKKVTDFLDQDVLPKYYYNGKPLYDRIKDDITEEGKIYQWRRKYVRENRKNVCPTLTANMGMGGHNVPIIKDKKGIRKLTPRECARLQGFPDDYKLPNIADSALYKQIGNSVSIPVVEAVAKKIKKAVN